MNAADPMPLGRDEWQLAGAQRSRLYGWFSVLYALEVSEQMFETYFASARFAPFAGLGELGLEVELERLEAATAALRGLDLPRLELAADFAQLFLLDARTGALPYASAHCGDDVGDTARLYGDTEALMRNFLAEHALAIDPGFREPADHLAVPLAFMADVAARDASCTDIAAAARAQAGFLNAALLAWLPRFAERCVQARPQSDFYPALAALLVRFVKADLSFLEDVAGSAQATIVA
ncbi:molecular chaperone TorD [Thauera sp.]